MSQHIYAVSSLPFLTYEQEVIPSRDFFNDIIRTHLSRDDFEKVTAAMDFNADVRTPGNAFLDKWRLFEMNLRNELALLRAKKKGREDSAGQRECEETHYPRQLARNAFQQDSPQAAEDLLNRGRWAYIEELEAGHYFDLEKLMAFGLKLGVLLRKAQFKAEKGTQAFDEQISLLKKTISDREYSYDKH